MDLTEWIKEVEENYVEPTYPIVDIIHETEDYIIYEVLLRCESYYAEGEPHNSVYRSQEDDSIVGFSKIINKKYKRQNDGNNRVE